VITKSAPFDEILPMLTRGSGTVRADVLYTGSATSPAPAPAPEPVDNNDDFNFADLLHTAPASLQ
jgi:hypothetical protein